ncbi:MAG: hypothetical protein ACPG8F_04630 [Flavobacteriaceae bacterium]|jgi:hypothetical protein
MISLKSSHLYIDCTVANLVFGPIHFAYAIYRKEFSQILITPVSSQWFIKMYDSPTQFLLKNRNLRGDKTIAIREILIDNELDMSDRNLEYEIIEKTSLIKINI